MRSTQRFTTLLLGLALAGCELVAVTSPNPQSTDKPSDSSQTRNTPRSPEALKLLGWEQLSQGLTNLTRSTTPLRRQLILENPNTTSASIRLSAQGPHLRLVTPNVASSQNLEQNIAAGERLIVSIEFSISVTGEFPGQLRLEASSNSNEVLQDVSTSLNSRVIAAPAQLTLVGPQGQLITSGGTLDFGNKAHLPYEVLALRFKNTGDSESLQTQGIECQTQFPDAEPGLGTWTAIHNSPPLYGIACEGLHASKIPNPATLAAGQEQILEFTLSAPAAVHNTYRVKTNRGDFVFQLKVARLGQDSLEIRQGLTPSGPFRNSISVVDLDRDLIANPTLRFEQPAILNHSNREIQIKFGSSGGTPGLTRYLRKITAPPSLQVSHKRLRSLSSSIAIVPRANQVGRFSDDIILHFNDPAFESFRLRVEWEVVEASDANLAGDRNTKEFLESILCPASICPQNPVTLMSNAYPGATNNNFSVFLDPAVSAQSFAASAPITTSASCLGTGRELSLRNGQKVLAYPQIKLTLVDVRSRATRDVILGSTQLGNGFCVPQNWSHKAERPRLAGVATQWYGRSVWSANWVSSVAQNSSLPANVNVANTNACTSSTGGTHIHQAGFVSLDTNGFNSFNQAPTVYADSCTPGAVGSLIKHSCNPERPNEVRTTTFVSAASELSSDFPGRSLAPAGSCRTTSISGPNGPVTSALWGL
jgi:hypothetical protein